MDDLYTGTLSVSVNCVWLIANATSRVDVNNRLRDCRTANIHTRNTTAIPGSAIPEYYYYTLWLIHPFLTLTLTLT